MLPEEIIDHIFSLCQDIASLKATTKAHPILLRIAERHLYTDIVLHDDTEFGPYPTQLPLNVGQLSNILSTNPRVPNYVYSLTIASNSVVDHDTRPFLEAIPSILALLPQLRKIVFDCKPYQILPESLYLSLGNCFGLPSIKQVKFRGIDIPLSLFRRMGNKVKMLMLMIDSCCLSEPELESPSNCPPLEELSMVHIHNRSLKTLAPWVASGCKQLSRLTFSPYYNYGGGPFVLIKPVLVSCSSTLTDLDLDVGSFYNADYNRESWTLLSLPQLQTFVFHGGTSYLNSHRTCFDVLTWLLGLMPHLKRLTLHLHFKIKSLDTNWSELDALLAASRSSTESIVLLMRTFTRTRVRAATYHDMKPQLMKYPNIQRLVEQKVLDIQTVLDA